MADDSIAFRQQRNDNACPFRFSLQTLILLTAFCELMCGWAYWLGDESGRWLLQFFPGWLGLLPVGMFIWTGFAWRRWPRGMPTDTMILASLATLWFACAAMTQSFSICSVSNPTYRSWADLIRDNLFYAWVSTITLPFFAALPAGYVIWSEKSLTDRSPARMALLIILTTAVVDLLLCSLITFLPFEIAARVWTS